MATISIIVTTYNIEKYLEQCLRSVAAQTHRDIEVLVVDDGSSDSTPELITKFAEEDSRFVPVLLPENTPGGVATAANVGLDRATGEWVGFVDGDDYVEPTMFSSLLDAALRQDSDLAMCQYLEVDDASGDTKEPADSKRWQGLADSHYELDEDLRKVFLRFIAVPWRKLYRRSLLEDHGIRFPEGDYFYEDNPFHWFSVVSASSIALVPSVQCYHRIARAGQTMATADARLFKIFQHHDTIHAWLEDRQLLDAYGTTLLGWVISQMEWISRRTPAELRRDLFDILADIFGQYSADEVVRALRDGGKGVTAERLSTAVHRGNFAAFVQVLAGRPDTTSPLATGYYHLRYSGVKHTALLTSRYMRDRLSSSKPGRVLVEKAGRSTTPSSSDVMFALMVIEQRLTAIERKIDDRRSE